MITQPNVYHNDALLGVNPYVRLAFYSTLDAHHRIRERIIYDYEIIFIQSGTATITVEDEVFEAQSGEIFFFRPGQRHSLTIHDETFVQPHIHFDLIYNPDLSSLTPVSFKNRSEMTAHEQSMIQPDVTDRFLHQFPTCIRLKNPLYVEQLIFDVINAYNTPEVFPEIRLKWRFLRLLDQLLCEISWQQTDRRLSAMERANLFKLYLEHHTSRRVTLDELAQVYHLDKSYVSRIFTATYGVTPIRYHLLFRLAKAKNMILYTTISLTAIAEQTGFSSLQDFSRAFRRIEGVTPSALR